ncbi:VOC family protein [Actinophytocola glycyrrhizae]|uniref:VOC family protein n=1 Tax=Actinophytocola glycyrrhizae TaxID=2044873 RepID=A0ABV9S5N5_9PSEU
MIIALPTADRVAAHAFYREAFGFAAFGEPADDGVPEPLQFRLGDDLTLMLIPLGGFGWTVGRPVAERGVSEVALSISVDSVDAAFARAVAAGADVVAEPEQKPWAYTAAVADPDGHVWLLT